MHLCASFHRQRGLPWLLGALLLTSPAAWAAKGVCGMPDGEPANPADLANGVSDLSLSHMAEQPAGLVTCSMGYLAEKCGDHATALKIFDKCIAKGYVGALIWKGHMYENGNGLPKDEAKAAAMFKQAAESGDEGYATLGKLHYASALYEGRGVPKDEALARQWFERAAKEGSPDAAEFLRTGYHTGSRDVTGRGVGTPPGSVQGQALVKQDGGGLSSTPLWQRVGLFGALLALMLGGAGLRQRQLRRGRPAPDAAVPAAAAAQPQGGA